MNAPKFRELRIRDLVPAEWNPSKRAKFDWGNKKYVALPNLDGLKDSISKYGVLRAIDVTSKNVVIEGHRRTAAAFAVGLQTIPAIIIDGIDPAVFYREANGHVRRHSGVEALEVWLKNPDAVLPKVAAEMAAMVEVIGRPKAQRMAADGFSLATYAMTGRLIYHCGLTKTPKIIVRYLDWMMKHSSAGTVLQALKANAPARLFIGAVRDGKPITMDFRRAA